MKIPIAPTSPMVPTVGVVEHVFLVLVRSGGVREPTLVAARPVPHSDLGPLSDRGGKRRASAVTAHRPRGPEGDLGAIQGTISNVLLSLALPGRCVDPQPHHAVPASSPTGVDGPTLSLRREASAVGASVSVVKADARAGGGLPGRGRPDPPIMNRISCSREKKSILLLKTKNGGRSGTGVNASGQVRARPFLAWMDRFETSPHDFDQPSPAGAGGRALSRRRCGRARETQPEVCGPLSLARRDRAPRVCGIHVLESARRGGGSGGGDVAE